MVVCVCNAIRERDLRDVAKDGQLPAFRSQYHQRHHSNRLNFSKFSATFWLGLNVSGRL
jgi:hypothetical protein